MSLAERDSGAQLLLDQLRASLQVSRYSARSVIASLAVSLGGSVLALLVFLTLRPRMKHLYAPNTEETGRLAGTTLAKRTASDGWVKTVWSTDERELLAAQGPDALVLMRFLKMVRNMFIILAILGCGIGIPINVIYNLRSQWSDNLSKSDAFIMMTPSLLSGNVMLAHVALGWVTNIVVVVLVYREYSHIFKIRHDVYMSPKHQRALVNRTVLATGLRKDMRSTRSLGVLANSISPGVVPSGVSVGTSVKHLEQLIEAHSHAIRQIEHYILKFRRRVEKYGGAAERPIIKGHGSSGKVDAIQYWEHTATELVDKIAQERFEARSEKRPLSYGFVSYPAQSMAHSIAQKWAHKKHQGTRLKLAPSPADIIWSNITLSSVERANKEWWVNVIYAGLMLVWIVPNAFIGCFLTNLSRLGALWPAFGRAMDRSPVGFAILQGVLAPIVTTLVFMILPWIMRKLSRWQGKLTRNEREREVIRKLYVFFFLINFFVFTLMGVIWDIAVQALSLTQNQHLSFHDVWASLRVPQRISTAVINISSFWVMYLLRANIGMFLELLQVISLSIRSSKVSFSTVTPRERLEWTSAQPYPFAIEYIWFLFYMTIGLAFTTIQPLVLAAAAAYFILAVPVKKYSAIYMFFTKYESNAQYWPLLNNTILFATGFGNLVLLCVVWVQAGYERAMAVVPLPFLLIIYKVFCSFKFDRHFRFFAEDSESMITPRVESKASLEEIYENPALNRTLDFPILSMKDAEKAAEVDAEQEKRLQNLGEDASSTQSQYRKESYASDTSSSQDQQDNYYGQDEGYLNTNQSNVSLVSAPDDTMYPNDVHYAPYSGQAQYTHYQSGTGSPSLPYPEHDDDDMVGEWGPSASQVSLGMPNQDYSTYMPSHDHTSLINPQDPQRPGLGAGRTLSRRSSAHRYYTRYTDRQNGKHM